PNWKPALGHPNSKARGWSQISPDMKLALRRQNDSPTQVFDWQSGRLLFTIPIKDGEFVFCNDTIIAASILSDWREPNPRIQISHWDANTGRELSSLEIHSQTQMEGLPATLGKLLLSENGHWLVEDRWSVTSSEGVVLWNTSNGKQKLVIPFTQFGMFARH